MMKIRSSIRSGIVGCSAALLLAVGACSAGEPGSVSDGNAAQSLTISPAISLVRPACADGTVEQNFGRGLVGCAGNVTFANRASLCGVGYRPVDAQTWHEYHGALAPTHHYWTNEELRYSGTGSGSCYAQYNKGTLCPAGQPMRVCAGSTLDPEGNACNWVNCGLEAGAADYFGGCVGNTTAGTLCVRNSGCADGTVEQRFGRGIVGCAGRVSYADAESLCTAGYMLTYDTHWTSYRGSGVPAHNYWTKLGPDQYKGSFSSCTATSGDPTASSCPADSPMRVCTPTGSDPEGNQCNWFNCGASWTSTGNEYFGGCFGNLTAGALCSPYACADGTTDQTWNKFIHGCAGSASFANKTDLCGPRTGGVAANTWTYFLGNLPPTHNYWVSDNLLWSGSGSGSCSVSTSSGFSCGTAGPMHVCTDSGSDAEGNTCNWTHCGLDSTSPDYNFGGCGATAGVLCATGP